MRKYWLSGAVIAIASAGGINAETTTYHYDALGRVIRVDDRSSRPVGHESEITYDLAGNRSTVVVAAVRFSGNYPAFNRLGKGESITSPNADYRFTLQFDGNLVLYDSQGRPLWSTGTSTGSHLDMQNDGNLVLYDGNEGALWSTQTFGNPGAYLAVQADSNLVIYDAGGQALWAR